MPVISQEIRKAVCERDGVLRPEGYSLHHCFFHSEIDGEIPKEELEQEWNYQAVPVNVHESIHNASTDNALELGHNAEIYYKDKALKRYNGKYKPKLEEIFNRKKKHYGIL